MGQADGGPELITQGSTDSRGDLDDIEKECPSTVTGQHFIQALQH